MVLLWTWAFLPWCAVWIFAGLNLAKGRPWKVRLLFVFIGVPVALVVAFAVGLRLIWLNIQEEWEHKQ